MRLSKWRTVAAAALLLLVGVVSGTQAETRGKDETLNRFIDNSLLLKLLQVQKLLPELSSKECDTEQQFTCIIEMKLITVGGRSYCLAVAPDLKVKRNALGGIFNKRVIRWKLSVPELDSKPLAFHAESGIVLTTDPQFQVDHRGDYGDGVSSSSPDTYYTRTKRNVKDAVTGYLPVILWGASGSEELCGAIDPKIVNVD